MLLHVLALVGIGVGDRLDIDLETNSQEGYRQKVHQYFKQKVVHYSSVWYIALRAVYAHVAHAVYRHHTACCVYTAAAPRNTT